MPLTRQKKKKAEIVLTTTTTHRHIKVSTLLDRNDDSHLSSKHGGGAKFAKSINVEVGILQLESSPFVFK